MVISIFICHTKPLNSPSPSTFLPSSIQLKLPHCRQKPLLLSTMGSGNSRLNAAEGGGVLPPKVRSTLLNRFEEFRKRRNGGAGTISKKQLLKDAEETEDEHSQNSHESETEDNKVLVLKETQPIKEETVVQVIATEKLSRVVPMPNPECEIEEQKDQVNQNTDSNKGKTEQVTDPNMVIIEHVNECIDQGVIIIDPKQGKLILVDEKVEAEVKTEVVHVDVKAEAEFKTGEGKIAEQAETEVKTEEGKIAEPVEEPRQEIKEEVGEKSDDDSDDDDEEDGEFGRFLCPGSPSFRIYYIEAEKRKDQEECKSPTIVMHHQKSHSADSVESSASRKSRRSSNDALEVLDVEIEPIAKGKGKKSKKFGPMKKLLKVKSCYYPMSTCTGNGRAHLIAAKAGH